jgi:hypothetical protein
MNMKRFLILSILALFVTVSCAAPNKVGGKKDNFRQYQYEEYLKQRIESSNSSPTFWQTLRCLVSYKVNPDLKEPMSIDEILLIPVMVAAQLAGLAIGIVGRGGGHL